MGWGFGWITLGLVFSLWGACPPPRVRKTKPMWFIQSLIPMGQLTSIPWDAIIPMALAIGMKTSRHWDDHPNHPNWSKGLVIHSRAKLTLIKYQKTKSIEIKLNWININFSFRHRCCCCWSCCCFCCCTCFYHCFYSGLSNCSSRSSSSSSSSICVNFIFHFHFSFWFFIWFDFDLSLFFCRHR